MGTQRRTLQRTAWWLMVDPSLYTPTTPTLLIFRHPSQLHKTQTINHKGLKHPLLIIHHSINHNLIGHDRFINSLILHHNNNSLVSLALQEINSLLSLCCIETCYPPSSLGVLFRLNHVPRCRTLYLIGIARTLLVNSIKGHQGTTLNTVTLSKTQSKD